MDTPPPMNTHVPFSYMKHKSCVYFLIITFQPKS